MTSPDDADDPIDIEPSSDTRRAREVDVPSSSLIVLGLLVVGTILLLRAIDRTQQLIALAAFAGILSALIAPVVVLVQKLLGRVGAAVVVHLVVVLVIVGSTGAVVQQVRAQSESLAVFTDEQISEVDGWSRDLLDRTRLDQRLEESAARWGTTAIVGDDDTSIVVRRVSELLIAIVLSTFFTLQGGALVDAAAGWTEDRRRRRRLHAAWSGGTAAAATYLRRNLVVAVATGVGASLVAIGFGLPAGLLIGVWAAALSMIPLLGTAVGWAPIVVLAAANESIGVTLAVSAISVLGIIATNVMRARYVTAPVQPGSFLVAMSIAAGLTVAGLPGAGAGMFLVVGVITALARPAPEDDAAEDDAPAQTTPSPSDVPDAAHSFGSDALEQLTARHDEGIHSDELVEGERRLVLTLSRRTALRITGFVILAFVVQLAITRVGPILVWAIVGALIAIGLDRPVTWVEQHWRVQRPVIVIVSALLAVSAVGVLVATATTSLDGSRPMDEGIAEFVSALEDLPLVGDRLAATDLEARVDRFQRQVPRLVARSPVAGQAAGLLGGGIVGAFWVSVAALTCLLDGPRLVRVIERRLPARIRRQSVRLARTGKVALGGYVAGAAVVASMNGAIVAGLGLAFGVPLVAVLAVWAFSWNFIPQIGAIIGWAPLILLAVLESPLRGLACLSIFIVYQAIENNAIQPTIVGHAVDISALAALGAALAGGALAGLIGAALAIPIAGVARALYRETKRDDFPAVASRRRAGSVDVPLP